jgi:SAM-dependent methyltransferase
MPAFQNITFRRVVKKLWTIAYTIIRDPIMIRDGLHPKGTYTLSASHNRWHKNDLPPVIRLPNLSSYYHPVLRGFWEFYGLGNRCLLTSEDNKIKTIMCDLYPDVSFVTTDYFTDLQSGTTDVVWDVCFPSPEQLAAGTFSSIVSNALMEHLIDPTAAFANMLLLLKPTGYLYALTHTPSFPLHRYPRDYVRFHHDYFEDLPKYLARRYNLTIELKELWSRRGQVVVCYQRYSR